MSEVFVTQADRDAAMDWAFIECRHCSEYEGNFEDDLAEAFACHRTAALEASAAGPWQKVGTFTPEPDALYLVQGTLRTSIKRGADIDADNEAAARIQALSALDRKG